MISINGIDVRVLRPVQSDDLVFIEYEARSLHAAITLIRDKGFAEPTRPQRDPTLPKGIRIRQRGFIVAYQAPCGTLKHVLK